MRFAVFTCLALAVLCIHSSDARRKVRSLSRQCTDQGFSNVCSISTKNPTAKNRCSQTLQCAVPVGRDTFKQPGGKIPDGTHCGANKICLNRKCMDNPDPEMPEVVGSSSSVKCKKVVPRANKIEPRPLTPLSP